MFTIQGYSLHRFATFDDYHDVLGLAILLDLCISRSHTAAKARSAAVACMMTAACRGVSFFHKTIGNSYDDQQLDT